MTDVEIETATALYLRMAVRAEHKRRIVTPAEVAQRLQSVDALEEAALSAFRAAHDELARATATTTDLPARGRLMALRDRPFGWSPLGQPDAPPGRGEVVVGHAIYRNPMEIWLQFLGGAGVAAAFVAVGTFLRDFGARRRRERAVTTDIESAVELREAFRTFVMQTMRLEDAGKPLDAVNLAAIADRTVRLNNAVALLSFVDHLEELVPVHEIGERPKPREDD